MRSVHTKGSTHGHLAWISPACFSPHGHCRRFCFPTSVRHASTFLPPFTPRPLRRFIATMRALTPARLSSAEQVSLLHVHGLPTIPSPTT